FDLAARGDFEFRDPLDRLGVDGGRALRLGGGRGTGNDRHAYLRPGELGAGQQKKERCEARRTKLHARNVLGAFLESEKCHNSAHFAMDFRLVALERWLGAEFPAIPFTLAPASEDASFRRYFRARFADGRSFVVMDAPPERENSAQFLHVAGLFSAAGVHVPAIHAKDPGAGFLLLEDLGDTTFLDDFRRQADPNPLYAAATDALIRIQLASRPGTLPEYDRLLLERELRLFPDWYVGRHLQRELAPGEREVLDGTFALLLANNLAQPRVYVHRDY